MLCQFLSKRLPARSRAGCSLWILITLLVASSSFLVFFLVHSVNGKESPVVQLTNGNLVGFTQNILDKPIYTYLNVPYALPANEFRFKPAQLDNRIWPEDRLAKSFGPSCPSPDPQIDYGGSNQDGSGIEYSEDCLQLNVWSPVLFNRTNPPDDKQLRPVFVFIHGGALLFGSAVEEKSFDGPYLASRGDLVVVTLNYRLGILGFLYNGNDIQGNLGLLDQRLALQWVSQNIQKFGGDPNKVTLAGESAGSWSVGIHLLLETKQPTLFHNAMMMSGSPLQPVLEEAEETALKKYELVLKRTKCQSLNCLQRVPLKELMVLHTDQEIINLKRNIFRLAFQPVYGPKNGFLSRPTFEQLTDRDHRAQNINLLFGNLVNEGQDAWTLWKFTFNDPVQEPAGSREEFIKALRNFVYTAVDLSLSERQILVENMEAFYFSKELPTDSSEFRLRGSLYQALSDLVFICPSKFFANSYLDKQQHVYEYKITYQSLSAGTNEFDPTCEEEKYGPCHTLDLQYLFGRPFKLASNYSTNDRTLSSDLIELVSQFARTGKAPWRPYFKMSVRRSQEMIVPIKFELNPATGNKQHTGRQSLSCAMFEKYFYIGN